VAADFEVQRGFVDDREHDKLGTFFDVAASVGYEASRFKSTERVEGGSSMWRRPNRGTPIRITSNPARIATDWGKEYIRMM
jgi:hypothetical protein